MTYRLLTLPSVQGMTGRRHSSIYTDVKNGLMPPPLKRGRSSLWPEHEISAVNAARIAGKNEEQIKKLVAELVAARVDACTSSAP